MAKASKGSYSHRRKNNASLMAETFFMHSRTVFPYKNEHTYISVHNLYSQIKITGGKKHL